MKKNYGKKFLCTIVAVALLLGMVTPAIAVPTQRNSGPPMDVSFYLEAALGRLVSSVPMPGFGTIAGEWTILTLARSGRGVSAGYFEGYLENIRTMIRGLAEHNDPNNPAAGWVLNPATGRREVRLGNAVQSTENARLVVALTALGIDASNFVVDGHSYDLVSVLNNRENLSSMAMYGERQGINGPIWSQIALNSRSWANPYRPSDRRWVGGTTASNPVTDAVRIQWILDVQLNNGGWDLGNHSPGHAPHLAADPDMTAMALQALAPHRNLPGVEVAIGRALAELSRTQLPNGGWAGSGLWGADNVQSSAQVVVALAALGIDPVNDTRFVKPGGNPVSAMLRFFDPATGGFIHAGGDNLMATDQATYALVAYDRFVREQASLYNMYDANPDFRNPHNIPGGGPGGLPGDINGDGVVNDLDLMALRLYLLGIDGNVVNFGALDVNGDGVVNDLDVMALRMILLGM